MPIRVLCMLEKGLRVCSKPKGHVSAHNHASWADTLTDAQSKAIRLYADARGGNVTPVIRRTLQAYGLLDVFQDETFGETFVLSAKGWRVYLLLNTEAGEKKEPLKSRHPKELFWSYRRGLRDGTEGRLKHVAFLEWPSYDEGYEKGRQMASQVLREYASRVGYDMGPASLLRSVDAPEPFSPAAPEDRFDRKEMEDYIKTMRPSKDSSSAILCEHANEVPRICLCVETCFCRREGSCRDQ